MNKTPIEWVKNPDGTQGYTWNPITGCLNHTPEGLCLGGLFPCYAYKLANGRLRTRYLSNDNLAIQDGMVTWKQLQDPFYPRLWEERIVEPIRGYHKADWFGVTPDAASEKGIFACDMSDLFGVGIPKEWTRRVMDTIEKCPQDRFYLLTKQPQNLIKFSPFPENCRVGVTVTDGYQWLEAHKHLVEVEAKVKFISFEPLLSEIYGGPIHIDKRHWLDWVIIGACTGTWTEMSELVRKYPQLTPMPCGNKWTAQPKIEWVEEIVRAADKAGIPVFLKDNLWSLFDGSKYPVPLWAFDKDSKLRQEMPE